ncbi:hypothetical protein ACVLV4_001645 [Rathayibacter agropyri]
MGNPVRGHGLHRGVGKGRIGGAIFGVAVSAVVGSLAVGRQWIAKRRTQPSEPLRDTRPGRERGPAGGTHEKRDDKPEGGGER